MDLKEIERKKKDRKTVISLLVVMVIMAFCINVTPTSGLTPVGLKAIGLIVSCVILWITNALPMAVTALLGMIAMPYLGIMEFSEMWPSFSTQVLFFVIASFGISAGLLRTNLPKRIIHFVLRISKGKGGNVVFGFCAATALISSVISDIPSVVMFAEIAFALLATIGITKENRTNFGRALMIAVPAGALLGGIATPSGNSLNLQLCLGLKELCGTNVTFLGWMLAGVPFAIIAVILTSIILIKVFKPEDVPQDAIDTISREIEELGSLSVTEKKYIVILLLTVVAWIMSTWFSFLNIAVVSIVSVVIMGLPGIKILSGEEWLESVNWQVVVMVGCIISMGIGVQKTGAVTWLLSNVANSAENSGYFITLLIISVIPCLLHMFLPLAGAMYALAFIPLITLGTSMGVEPAAAMFIFAIWMNNEYILPTDAIICLSFGYEMYSSKDLMKAGVWITLMLIILSVTIVPPLTKLMVIF